MEREGGESQEVQFSDKTKFLLGICGREMVALVALHDPLDPESYKKIQVSDVDNWALGVEPPLDSARKRVNGMYDITEMMLDAKVDSGTVRSWFLGMNPELEDRNPALTIAEDIDAVKNAALAYIQGDY